VKNEHNILDKFLQETVNQSDFMLNEDHWSKMSSMLDEDDKQKKRLLFWRGFSIFIGLLLISIGAFLFPKFKHKQAHQKQQIQTEMSMTSSSLPSANQDSPMDKNQSDEFIPKNQQKNDAPFVKSAQYNQKSNLQKQSELANQNEALVNANDDKLTYQQVKETEMINDLSHHDEQDLQKIKKQSLKPNNVKKTKHNVIDTQADAILQSKKQSIRTNLKTSSLNNNNDVQTLNNSKVSTSKNEGNVTDTKSKKVDAKVETLAKNKASLKTALLRNKKIQTKNNVEAQKEVASSINPTHFKPIVQLHGKNMIADDTIRLVGRQAIDAAISNPRYNASLKNYVPEYADKVTILTFKPQEASTQNINAPVSQELSKKEDKQAKIQFIPKPFEFFFTAGVSANKGLQGNASSPMAWGYSPYVGFGVDKPVFERITMSSHVGFTYFNGLNVSEKSTSIKYSFGVDSVTTNYTHKRLFQTYLPVSLYYQVMRNHFLMASIGAMYSFNVGTKVENVETSQSIEKTGYRSGFNQFDAFANVGYSYQIMKKIMLQISVQQGFMDMTKNSYFNNAISNTQTRIQLGIKYNFKRNDN
jgi:hypothetical protein